jgi:CubicO group peptidase (beta-lactamase class C family)/lysophospholipase L1-like esterase
MTRRLRPIVLLFLLSVLNSAVPAADRFALPVSENGLPGEGALRRYEGYVKRWAEFRAAWAKQVEQDQRAVVFLGDSITQGWGAKFRDQFPGMKLANRGIGGDTTRGMLIRLQEDVLALNPSAIVILAGTNDIEVEIDADAIGRNFQKILAAIKEHNPKTPIVLCRMFPSSAEKKRPRETIDRVNSLYDAAVKGDSQITVVDTWTLFANEAGDADPTYFPDLLHLNAAGYQRWAAALRPVFATLGFSETEADDFQPEPGFVSLFNGRDLTGWGFRPTPPRKQPARPRPDAPVFVEIKEAVTFDGKTESSDGRYAAINGRLVVKTPSEGRRIQQLWTTEEFGDDFILKLEFRATPNADSGVFIRQPQLQCRDYLLAGPYKELKQFREGDWNALVVTVKGGVAHATCNGELLTDDMAVPETGPIGLEGDRGQMEYRRIRLKWLPAGKSTSSTESAGFSDEARAAVRAEIKAVIGEGYYPGVSILLIQRDQIVMREAHGVANLETQTPFTVDELCWLASTGKIFTATLMAKLVDDGVLKFDDPIAKSFPEFADIRLRDGGMPSEPVRIRHAMSHTSGIPSDGWMEQHGFLKTDPKQADYYFPQTPQDFVSACVRLGLVAEPGTKMMYGRPIDLCACVAQKQTGRTFIELMQDRVFKPLGLRHSSIQPTADELQRLAPLYQSKEPHVFEPDSFGLEVAERQHKRLSTAGGGVYSTLDDLGVLMQLHLHHGVHSGKQLIKAETLRQLYEPQPGTNDRYGLAFQLHESNVNGHSKWHSHPGYSGPVAWIDFDRDLSGVLLMQSNTVGRAKHHQRIIDTIYRFLPAAKTGI